MATEPYPVLAEHNLSVVPRKLLRGYKREAAEIPVPPPGTVLVFEVDGRREVIRRQHLTGAESVVVRAVGVSVVSVRRQLVTVDMSMPSSSAADQFLISVGFHCQVERPDVVAEAGLTDLVLPLREHLAQDRDLLHRCAQFSVEEIARVRSEATARVSAFCRYRPPWIDGIAITLGTVVVYTPQPLQAHETVLRDERWDQEKEELRRHGEEHNINHQARMLRDPEWATATAVARGDMRAAEVSDRMFRERDQQREQLLDMVKSLADAGRLDRVSIDEKLLVDELTRVLTGAQAATDGQPLPTAEPPRRIGGSAPTASDDPDESFVYVDEDELTDE